MKKIISVILVIFAFFITYFIQVNIFNTLLIFDTKCNLFIIFFVVIGLFGDKNRGFILGVFCGSLLDILIGKNIGTIAIMLGMIGYFSGVLNNNFTKESRITQIIIVFFSTIIYEIGIYFFNIVFLGYPLQISNFMRTTIIEAIYNSLLTMILYSLILKLGNRWEESFFKNKGNGFYIK